MSAKGKKGAASPDRGTFGELLKEQLTDPEFAAAYLNEHISYQGPDSQDLILQAMKNVAEAHGMSKAAEESNIPRRTLYHAFAAGGNPTLDTMRQFLHFAGIEFSFKAAAAHHSSRRTRFKRAVAKTNARSGRGLKKLGE